MKMNENIHKNIYSENNKTNLENPISLEIKGFRERINFLLERSNITLNFKEKKEIIELLNTDKNISLYKKNDEIIKISNSFFCCFIGILNFVVIDGRSNTNSMLASFLKKFFNFSIGSYIFKKILVNSSIS